MHYHANNKSVDENLRTRVGFMCGVLCDHTRVTNELIVAVCYILLRANEYGLHRITSEEEYFRVCRESEERTLFLQHYTKSIWKNFHLLNGLFTPAELKRVILTFEESPILAAIRNECKEQCH